MASPPKARALIAALAVALACACAGMRPQLDPAEEARLGSLFQKAEAYYRNHFYGKALDTYHEVLNADPEGEFADNALYKIAGIHLRREEWEKAVAAFDRLRTDFPRSPYAEEALYNAAFCYHKMGDPTRALEVYEDYLARPSSRNKPRARFLASQARADLGRYDDALDMLAVAGNTEPDRDKQIEILHFAKTLIDERLTADRLIVALKSLPDGIVADYARFRAAQDALGAGDAAKASELLSAIDFRRAKFKFYKEAESLKTQAGGTGARPTVIVKTPKDAEPERRTLAFGVVLPLSGKMEIYGEQVLHGVMLAVDTLGSRKGVPRIEAVIRDSEGDPERAAELVADLAKDERVVAIVGPLLVKEAEPAADAAERASIPMLALSRKDDLIAGRTWVFRNAVTFHHQARALIDYAGTHLGARRFAIVYPETEFGEAFRDAFEAELDPQRQSLKVATGYSASDTDFRRAARAVADAGEVDAVFIPDTADRVALLAPQLVYYGVKNVHLLGPSSWNQDSLAQKAGAYLSRAVIVDGFFAGAADPVVKDFSGRFEDMYGKKPDLLAAQGYDAVSLLAHLAETGAADSRAGVRRGLLQTRAFPALTGKTTFLENGEVEKTLYLLRVGQNGIEEMY